MVELALAIPLLLIVLFGIIDFGRAINYWNDETNLANLGARYAAVGTLSDTNSPCASFVAQGLVAYLKCQAGQDSPELLNGSGNTHNGVQNPPGIKVCVSTPNGDAVGQQVTVKVTAPYQLFPTPKILGGSTPGIQLHLTGTATMRIEQPASAGGLDITAGSSTSC
jgi:Flp pilus assembly protein TadG